MFGFSGSVPLFSKESHLLCFCEWLKLLGKDRLGEFIWFFNPEALISPNAAFLGWDFKPIECGSYSLTFHPLCSVLFLWLRVSGWASSHLDSGEAGHSFNGAQVKFGTA